MPDDVDLPGPSPRLVREWTVCAIAYAAARFIPVPLLDDAVRENSLRVAFGRTLRAHGRDHSVPDLSTSDLEPLYAGVEGWRSGAGRYLRSVPRRVILFPVRKYVALFGAVKGVPTDVMTGLLLAHTLDRALTSGRLAGPDAKAREQQAAELRQAFDEVLDDMDLRVLAGALGDALSRGRGLTRAAVGYARNAFGRGKGDAEPSLEPGGAVGEGAEHVVEALRRPDVRAQVAEFDARLDARLAGHP